MLYFYFISVFANNNYSWYTQTDVDYFNLICRVLLPVLFEFVLYSKHMTINRFIMCQFEIKQVLSVSVFQTCVKLETSSELSDPPTKHHQPSASIHSHRSNKQVS